MENPRSVPEIAEATQLLEGYERSAAHNADARDFSAAVEMLDDYLDENPQSIHRQFIENLRLSHTRRMLQKLSSLPPGDFSSMEHLCLVLVTVRKEAENVMQRHPDLQRAYDALLKAWGEPLAKVLIRFQDEEGKRGDT